MVLALSTGLEKGLGPSSKWGLWAFCAGLGQLTAGIGKIAKVDQKQPEMETDGLGPRNPRRERAEPGERERGPILVVQADRGRGQGLRVVGRQLHGGPE